MTRQEEIKGIVKAYLVGSIHGALVSYGDLSGYNKSTVDFQTDELLSELSDRGIVLKADRELPAISPELLKKDLIASVDLFMIQQDMIAAGYVAVIPLIDREE